MWSLSRNAMELLPAGLKLLDILQALGRSSKSEPEQREQHQREAWEQLPAAVCVKDATARNSLGQIVPAYYPRPVTDNVTGLTGQNP